MRITHRLREACWLVFNGKNTIHSDYEQETFDLCVFAGLLDARLELTESGRTEALTWAAKLKARNARASANRRAKDEALRSCGLTKVRGSVSGKVYWE